MGTHIDLIEKYLNEGNMTAQQASKKMRQAGKDWYNQGKKHFKNDKSMLKVYKDDQQTFNNLADLILKDVKQAYYMANQRVDTIIREAIPSDVWKWLLKNGSK